MPGRFVRRLARRRLACWVVLGTPTSPMRPPAEGELTELGDVGPHGEDLTAEGIRPEPVTARVEDHRAGDTVLYRARYTAAWWEAQATAHAGHHSLGEVRDLKIGRTKGYSLLAPTAIRLSRLPAPSVTRGPAGPRSGWASFQPRLEAPAGSVVSTSPALIVASRKQSPQWRVCRLEVRHRLGRRTDLGIARAFIIQLQNAQLANRINLHLSLGGDSGA